MINFLIPLVLAKTVAALISHLSTAGGKLSFEIKIKDMVISVISWKAGFIATYSAWQVERTTQLCLFYFHEIVSPNILITNLQVESEDLQSTTLTAEWAIKSWRLPKYFKLVVLVPSKYLNSLLSMFYSFLLDLFSPQIYTGYLWLVSPY